MAYHRQKAINKIAEQALSNPNPESPLLKKQIELESRVSDLLNLSSPYPTSEVLSILIQATEHLMTEHTCDTHGHERFVYAMNEAKKIIHKFSTVGTASNITAKLQAAEKMKEALEETKHYGLKNPPESWYINRDEALQLYQQANKS